MKIKILQKENDLTIKDLKQGDTFIFIKENKESPPHVYMRVDGDGLRKDSNTEHTVQLDTGCVFTSGVNCSVARVVLSEIQAEIK